MNFAINSEKNRANILHILAVDSQPLETIPLSTACEGGTMFFSKVAYPGPCAKAESTMRQGQYFI